MEIEGDILPPPEDIMPPPDDEIYSDSSDNIDG